MEEKEEKTKEVEEIKAEVLEKKVESEVLEPKEEAKQDIEAIEKTGDNEKNCIKEVISETENKTMDETKTHRKSSIFILIFVIILILLTLSAGFAIINIWNSNILFGVKVANIDIGGLTKEQATRKIKQIIDEENGKEFEFKINEEEFSILPSQIETSYDIELALDDAYKYGRNSNIFVNNYQIIYGMIKNVNIDLSMKYNEKLLNDYLNGVNSKIANAIVETNYYIDKDAEELVVRRGIAGNKIDIEAAKEQILSAIKNKDYSIIIIDALYQKPQEINLDKIHDEVVCEPKDAYYTKDPFQVYEEKDGIDFDLNKAKELLKENKEEYVIELIITKAEKTVSEIGTEAFPDLLGSCITNYDAGNKPRTTNLILATEKLDGVIVKPEEIFSYNKTLGERTYSAGYRDAAGYAGGKVVQMLGGGICQISSTLYDAVVFANLEIVERYNHMFLTSYIGAGKDATVSYGTLDFKFKNTRSYPIMIKASAKDGVATVQIFGFKKEENEYDIEISSTILNYIPFSVIYEDSYSMDPGTEKKVQGGMNGCKSITYKIFKTNGLEVKKEVLSTDTYKPMNKIIMRGIVEETVVETNNEAIIPEEPTTSPEEQSNTESIQNEQTQDNITLNNEYLVNNIVSQ